MARIVIHGLQPGLVFTFLEGQFNETASKQLEEKEILNIYQFTLTAALTHLKASDKFCSTMEYNILQSLFCSV